MPLSGEYGSTINWTTANDLIITSDGQVTRPGTQVGDQRVTLEAQIVRNSGGYGYAGYAGEAVVFYRNFDLLVLAEERDSTPAELARTDYDLLQPGYAEGDDWYNVRNNLTLPSSGSFGSTVTWTSTNTAIVGISGTNGIVSVLPTVKAMPGCSFRPY